MAKVDWELVASGLSALSDREFQSTSWLSSGEESVSSIVEDICQTFDDSGLSDAMSLDDAIFATHRELQSALDSLSSVIDKINLDQDPRQLIDDPHVHEMRVLSDRALHELRKVRALL
ncbi:MAG: hypothetical protein R3B67_13495 [Phycisphaerales bacterium]